MQNAQARNELTALVTAALDPYFADSNPKEYAALFAADAIQQLFAAYAGNIPPDRYEILDPTADLHGDTAIFTFNLDTFSQDDGSVTSRWNTTQIHSRSADGWDMIHAHWSHRESAS